MNILCIGDLHFNIKRLKHIKKLKEDIRNIIKENNIDIIVFLGDILDNHKNIHLTVLNETIIFFKKLSKLEKKIYVLVGNHDRTNNQVYMTNEHPFYMININNVEFISKTKQVNELLFVPYVPNGRFNDAINGFDLTNIKCIFAHQEFKGCMLNKHITSKNGDDYSNYPYIISGHIHTFHKMENVLYIGTPYQISIDESEKKYYVIFDTETHNIKKIRTTFEYQKIKEINIEDIDNIDDNLENTKLIVYGKLNTLKINKHKIKDKTDNFVLKPIKSIKDINLKNESFIDILFKLMTDEEKKIYEILNQSI